MMVCERKLNYNVLSFEWPCHAPFILIFNLLPNVLLNTFNEVTQYTLHYHNYS